jgi:hypothetical protein
LSKALLFALYNQPVSSTFSKAIELARKLPEKDQEALGALLLEEMRSEKRWAELFRGSQEAMGTLADQALAEHEAGKTRPWD